MWYDAETEGRSRWDQPDKGQDAMSDGKVRGVVHVIEETKTYGQKGFRKRLVVLEQDKQRFVNYVPLEFTNDDCDSVDALKVGDEIEVDFWLNGRKWQKDSDSEVKFFLNASAAGFKVLDGKSTSSDGDADDDLAEAALDDDDVPF
jgi:hypothetical protein